MILTIATVARHQQAKARRAGVGPASPSPTVPVSRTPTGSLVRVGPGTDLWVGIIGGPTRFVW
jgi:hypothetical protein